MDISKRQYKKALLAEGVLKDRSLELLSALYDAPNCEATAPQLAKVLGYESYPPVNALIGKLGKRITLFLGLTKEDIKTEFTGWWQVVANGKETAEGFTWWLKENLFVALFELNLLQEYEVSIFPETLSPFEELSEGKKKTITVNAYERNSVARNICISHYGHICSVCSLNFEEMYGEIGKGFIHVHHLVELSSLKSEYKVDPINDLCPVCPNCHAMLHRKKPSYSIEVLKDIIKKT